MNHRCLYRRRPRTTGMRQGFRENVRLDEALDSVPEIEERAKELDQMVHGFDAQRAQLLGLVIDSVLRTADYGANISEIALQSAAPSP